ncbi:MAG: flagella basal body P-ring formation protein FlgA [Proteobacteria bacterium]|jgi:flagella basal body P-ring formation protein FlgA|nr:MAG: flagella basal body P-ring formation protein FlgA [Pseudomonadota bacterium]
MRTLRAGLFRCLLASTFLLIVCAYTSQLLAARISLPVPRITLYPGDTIRADHLVDRAFRADPGRQHPVYRSREDIVGKIARRTLLPNRPIPINALRAPHLVVQGTVVQIVFREGPLEILGHAVALQSGGKGDVISLRNIDSGVIIKGVVEADGTVQVGIP